MNRSSIYQGLTLSRTCAAATACALLAGPTSEASTNSQERAWSVTGSASLKETFDSNVFLQSETDKANRSTLVTSLLPQMGLNWKPGSRLNLAATYAPEAHFFHSESSEDFFLHRATAALSGRFDSTAYEFSGSGVVIDGSSLAPTWSGPGGAPATGAPIVRDRRDATVFRTSARITQSFGEWFIRPVATFYIHDFQTEHRSTPGYQNFVDRSEMTVGADAGRSLDPYSLWTGYRFGMQDQDALLGSPLQYDSRFHRILFGIDGKPLDWLKINLNLGPEFREFHSTVATGFGSLQHWNFFVEASATATLSKSDTITISAKRFEQPGSSGRGTYQDGTYDLVWRHNLNDEWVLGLGGRGYNTDFRSPTRRDDWVVSANTFVNWTIDRHTSVEASYIFETGLTRNRNAAGREYQRHLIAFGIKYSFQ